MYEIIIQRGKQGKHICYQQFSLEADDDTTVACALDELNKQEILMTDDGLEVEKIRWESNCRQKMCGACGMLINHKPMLACKALLKDLGECILLEPLSKFPCVQDLVVDKSVLHNNMVKMNLWLRDKDNNPLAAKELSEKAGMELYKSASCIQCGLCLEACPNYTGIDDFFGAALMNTNYKIANQESEKKTRKKQIKSVEKHFLNGCSNSFACQEVCPVGIPLSLHISRMNALAWKTIGK